MLVRKYQLSEVTQFWQSNAQYNDYRENTVLYILESCFESIS